jgi:hypothetical protein
MKNRYGGLNAKSNIDSTLTRELLTACRKLIELDDVATLQFLVETGLNIPENTLGEFTPLMIAAAELGKFNIVKFLFEKGYKYNEK